MTVCPSPMVAGTHGQHTHPTGQLSLHHHNMQQMSSLVLCHSVHFAYMTKNKIPTWTWLNRRDHNYLLHKCNILEGQYPLKMVVYIDCLLLLFFSSSKT